MAKFTVSVTETSYGAVEVEADTPEEARSKAAEAYHQGNVHWSTSEFTAQEAEEN